MEFKEKFIGFVDILGFQKLVKSAETGTGIQLSEIITILTDLGSAVDVEKLIKYGPTICPESQYVQRDLDFRLTQISDCVVVSSEVSPAGAIHLINHCWKAVINLMIKGIMCRGCITKGSIYHTDRQFIGSGYQNAYLNESKIAAFKREGDSGTPFVEVDSLVCDYVKQCNDPCVKNMFSRMVKSDGTITALFPFQQLAHSFMIGGFGPFAHKFDSQKEKDSNQKMRELIKTLRERIMQFIDETDTKAVKKAEYYISFLETQLKICDNTDHIIDMLNSPFPPHTA